MEKLSTHEDKNNAMRPKPMRNRYAAALIVLLLVLTATGLIVSYETRHTVPLPTTPALKDALHKPARYYCSVAGSALLCQNIQNGSTTKYRLPGQVGNITAILPSPDDSKLIIQTAPNPLYVNDKGHIWLSDSSLSSARELAATTKVTDSSIAWIDANTTIAVAQRDPVSGKSKVALANVSTGKLSDTGYETSNTVTLSGSAAGDYIIAVERGTDKPLLKLINAGSHKVLAIDTTSITKSATSYANAVYDNIRNVFYITASGKDGRLVVLVAKLSSGSDSARLTVTKVIDDGYAYSPITTVAAGVLASRQHSGSALVQYGILQETGHFAANAVTSGYGSAPAFGLVTVPKTAPVSPNHLVADDYLVERVAAAGPLQTLLTGLVQDPACPTNHFNSVELLAKDDNQVAVQFAGCTNDPAELRYYTKDAGDVSGYRLLGKSYGTPTCQLAFGLQLSDTVAPSCDNK